MAVIGMRNATVTYIDLSDIIELARQMRGVRRVKGLTVYTRRCRRASLQLVVVH